MAAERRVGDKTFKDTFTGKDATDWLVDYCTTIDTTEAIDVASRFVEYDLIEFIQQDKSHMEQHPGNNLFQPTKSAIYQLTAKGKDLVNGASSSGLTSVSEGVSASGSGITRDSNTQWLGKILNDAALRLLFREYLWDTGHEDYLSFYLDVDEFVRNCGQAIGAVQKNPSTVASMDGIKEVVAQAYRIYNALLVPGSPCTLNIDHQLRKNLATRMTKVVGQDAAMIDTLHEVTALFQEAQNAVFSLMASVRLHSLAFYVS
ncbi:hypothetical protein DL771_010640 [Monosporascus sp. 5C6A]|nr:hypothetical protein DL771_010640 [Monosporascus sp. 5C6A]